MLLGTPAGGVKSVSSGAISQADRADRGKTIYILHTLLLTIFKFYGNIKCDIKGPWLSKTTIEFS